RPRAARKPALRSVPLRDVPGSDRLTGRAGQADECDGGGDRPRGHHRAVRDRWFGATGRRVPEIALEGELDLGDALVLDALDDEALRTAHDAGRPVVVRRPPAQQVKNAPQRPRGAVLP